MGSNALAVNRGRGAANNPSVALSKAKLRTGKQNIKLHMSTIRAL